MECVRIFCVYIFIFKLYLLKYYDIQSTINMMWVCRQTEVYTSPQGGLTLKNMDTRGFNPYHGDVN